MSKMRDIQFTEKQRRFWHEANSMYNFKVGGTGSGKTYMDYFLIPKRLDEVTGKGSIVIFGNTKGTIQRNVIEKMQEVWGRSLVSNISSNNTCRMFGKTVHVLGADNRGQVDRVRGMTIEYTYGDELTTWNNEVFEIIKSRLRVRGAKMDGTANPKEPTHWLKKFIDEQESTGLLYHQHYVLDDGVLDDDPVENKILQENIKNSYEKDSVFYKRDVLGLWAREDGLVYPTLSQKIDRMIISKLEVPKLHEVIIGIDFGNSSSNSALVATGFANQYRDVYILSSREVSPNISEAEFAEEYVAFLREIEYNYGVPVRQSYADSALQVWIGTLRNALEMNGLRRAVYDSEKGKVMDRIHMTSNLIAQGRLWFLRDDTDEIQEAMLESSWDTRGGTQKRLDDNDDILDAFEYSFTPRMNYLMRAGSLRV